MTESDTPTAENSQESRIPRHDWILLPSLSVLTILVLTASAWLIARQARQMWFWEAGSTSPCLVFGDPSTGARAIPGTVCRVKTPEDLEPVEYRFNSSGYRADAPFGPKPPGTYRIVMVGSSFAMGMHVAKDKAFAELMPKQLSKRTGTPVEIYNEGMHTGFARRTALSFRDALAVEPDLILWVLTVSDIRLAADLYPEGATAQAQANGGSASSQPDGLLATLRASFTGQSPLDVIRSIWDRSITSFVLRHFLYESQSLYLNASLMPGDHKNDYLQVASTPAWQVKLAQFESYASNIESRAKAAGVPVVAVYIPYRAPAAMISIGEYPDRYDPYKLGNDLRSIIGRHGGTYIDILPAYRVIPNPEQYYLPIDGHANAKGHAILADLLTEALTNGSVPALRAAGEKQIVAK